MPETDCTVDFSAAILRECTEEALGTMLFAGIGNGIAIQMLLVQPLLSKVILISGPLTGKFRLAITAGAADALAIDFQGLESKPECGAIDQVVGELANMICGASLRRIESETRFSLSRPEPDSEPIRNDSTFQCFELEQGLLAVSLDLS